MAKWRIEHHRELCIGCGACAAISPENWVMDEDGKPSLVGHLIDENNHHFKIVLELGSNKDASEACPVPCIFIKKIE